MKTEDWGALYGEITEVFSPGAPIQERELFAGRINQLQELIDAVQQRGRHAIVFGERGVGKTSLANILSLAFSRPSGPPLYVRVNATPEDTFSSLWKKVFRRLSFQSGPNGETKRIADSYPGELTPDDVQLELSDFPTEHTPIIVLDEFDRIQDKRVTTLVADTIKALSDYSVGVTVIVVGVSEDVSSLIAGHESISRSLKPVEMPRMSQDELADIIYRRYKRLGLTPSSDALWKMTFLSRGLPYYAHLLGMHSARIAVQNQRKTINENDVDAALSSAIDEIDQKIKVDYYAAVLSQRSEETLYEPVLLACALCVTDQLGRFQQSAVAGPLEKITGKAYRATTYAFHMNAMTSPGRAKVLQQLGEARNYRYRFTDPMMQPFAILKGLSDRRIDDETADIYATRRQLQLSIEP